MRPILDIEPPQSQAELLEELNERFAAIGDNFASLGQAAGTGPASRTYTASPRPQSPFSYVNPTINVFEFLDPLYAQLRTAQMQLREVALMPNSVGQSQLQIDSILARHIVAGTITADKLSVSELSAITANMGTITAGNITLGTSGFIRGGATGYNSGSGWWMGYDAGVYKFFIGDSAGSKLLWNGTTLSITGSITATSGTIGGFDIGSDYIRDSINSSGIASTVTGGDDIRFWAGNTFANRAIAPFRVSESGAITGAGQCFFANLVLKANQINEVVTNALAEVRFNFDGYNGGTTQYRDTAVYDGKNNLVARFTGSTPGLTVNGTITANSGAFSSNNFSGSSSGTNTGDQTNISGTASNITAYTINQNLGTSDNVSFNNITGANVIANTQFECNGNTGITDTFVVGVHTGISINGGIITGIV